MIDGANAWQRFVYITLPHAHADDPVHRAAAHDLDVEPHRHDLHHDARRARDSATTPRRSTASCSRSSSISAIPPRSPWCWRSSSMVGVGVLRAPPRAQGARMSGAAVRRAAVLAGRSPILAYSLAPFVWMAIASITPEARPDTGGPWLSGRADRVSSRDPTLQNYASLFANLPFAIYFRNSAIVATGTMCLALIGRQPRRLRFRALPLQGPRTAAGRDTDGLHDSRASSCSCRCSSSFAPTGSSTPFPG